MLQIHLNAPLKIPFDAESQLHPQCSHPSAV